MGNQESMPTSTTDSDNNERATMNAATGASLPQRPSSTENFANTAVRLNGNSSIKSEHIANLIHYAKFNYETNPTDSLLALVQALTLNSGEASAHQAMGRIRSELGAEVADHVLNRQGRMERAMRMVGEMLEDQSTCLYEQGRQHILQQAMEDGSSVVCAKCHGMVPASRWQQHQRFWCQAKEDTDERHTSDNLEEKWGETMDL